MADSEETCDYVARKEDPSNWHGDDPDDWVLEHEAPVGLEQKVWECPHESLDGEEYCPFHTDPKDVPDDVDEGERFVEIINEASAVDDDDRGRQQKEFVGATFGAFDIEEATLDAGDEHPIRLDHARFARGVNANKAVFKHNVLATRTRFEAGDGKTTGEIGEVSFYRTKFGEGEVSFRSAEFGEGVVSFRSAEFGEGGVSFKFAEFGEDKVSFNRAEFGEGRVSFENMSVNAPLSFLDTRFDAGLRMTLADAEFHDDVTFGSLYDESVPYLQHSLDFSGAIFRRALEFRDGTDSTTGSEESDLEKPQFDFVFAGDVNFSDVTFQDGIDFSNTRFPSDAKFTDATLEGADFEHADVTGVESTSTASFDGTNLTDANFSRAELAGASFERARLNRAELLWANLAGAKLYGALLGDARINRETDFWLDGDDSRREPDASPGPVRVLRRVKMAFRDQEPYCSYDPRYRGSDGSVSLGKAGEVYGTLENLARNNSLPGLASECFLGRKDVQLRKYWRDGETTMAVRSFVPTLVARYGESPARVLGTGAVTVLAFGLVYYAFGLVERANSGDQATLFQSFYFSGLTFTTLGYGDFNPVNQWGQILAVLETSIGVVLLAILVFVFSRRATR